ncbi:hypothetical protein [Tumebacillus flagellatus]|uniref:Uncharacterized protein n=1 Tax=Tumebacillus flagellatus TaxID=1157490 RepID=A0A074LF19_9BACL|nr:hypothetical protein [Tumebacillus flagellatus]KEO80841.1 hypothetical protein EL26_24105 [Tumebacillus flagellatus]
MGYEFGQVLGELMKSIITARSLSDKASRELAISYERDELLRAFPVPFVELENVEIELKFAFQTETGLGDLPYIESIEKTEGLAAGVEDDLVQETARRVSETVINAMTTLQRLVTLTKAFEIEQAGRCIEETVVSVVRDPTRLSMATQPPAGVKLAAFDVRRVVTKVIYALMKNGMVTLTKKHLPTVTNELVKLLGPISLEHEEKTAEVRGFISQQPPTDDWPTTPPIVVIGDGVDDVPYPTVPVEDPVPTLRPTLRPTLAPTTAPTTAPDDTPRPIPVPGYSNPMNVIIQANELLNLPAEMLSSIKITVNVSNYEWTGVDRGNGQSTRKLTRE